MDANQTEPKPCAGSPAATGSGRVLRVSRITAKGKAFLWVADHVKPLWLRNLVLTCVTKLPLWVFERRQAPNNEVTDRLGGGSVQ